MKYLLDTCVVSEFARETPDPRVVSWLRSALEPELVVSALTFGELRYGVARLSEGKRRRSLSVWLDRFRARFDGRVLDVTSQVADEWASLRAAAARAGRTLPVIDGLLAATAKVHGLSVVTRNLADFAAARVTIIDPWRGGA